MEPAAWVGILAALVGLVGGYLRWYTGAAIAQAAKEITREIRADLTALRAELVSRELWGSEVRRLDERINRLEGDRA